MPIYPTSSQFIGVVNVSNTNRDLTLDHIFLPTADKQANAFI